MLALAVVCIFAPAVAQSLFGTILGTVTDKSQALIPRATVRIRNLDTNEVRTVMTNQSGDYQAPALPVGAYQISFEAAGFKQIVAPRVVLAVDQRRRVDVQLELGSMEQRIEVTTQTAIIETDTASQGTVVDNRRIVRVAVERPEL